MIKQNNKHHTIVALMKESREHTTSVQEVSFEFVSYFQSFMGIVVPCTNLDSNTINLRPILTATLIKFDWDGNL